MEKAKPCREILAEYLKKQGDSDAVAEANALTFVIETLNNQKTVSAPVGKGFSQEASVRPSVPIIIGGDPDYDACGGVGIIKGLDPHGDGFLAVKSGPTLSAARLDKLYNGDRVYICSQKGNWVGIVYSKGYQQCNVSTPWPEAQPYTGPCRSGWAYKTWIRPYAG